MGFRLVTPPATTPVSLAEAKQHLRVDHTDEDALITTYIGAATKHLEGDGILGCCFVTQTWDLFYDAFPCGAIRLRPPLQSVSFVNYIDVDGVTRPVPATDYEADVQSTQRAEAWVVPASGGWPATMDTINAAQVRFISGYGNASQVPEAIKASILLIVGDLYKARETIFIGETVAQSGGLMSLIAPFRIVEV